MPVSTARPSPPIRLFRAILRLLPDEFRADHGPEMEQVFRTQHRAAAREGRASVWALWWETISGFARAAPREHLTAFHQDGRYALRTMRQHPGFAASAVLTLTIGIGAATAIFSVINAVAFRPLPVAGADRLVALATRDRHVELPHGLSYADIRDYRTLSGIFGDVLGYTDLPVHLSAASTPERIFALATTDNYFTMLGLTPSIGRFYVPGDTRGPASPQVVVLSHGYWQRRFGGDPTVIGSSVKVNGLPFTVIGVTPASFRGLHPLLKEQIYLPVERLETLFRGLWSTENRASHDLRSLARLQPGVTVEQAHAAVEVMAKRLAGAHPQTNEGVSLLVMPEPRARPEPALGPAFRVAGGVLMALVALLVLLVCANVANLQLARASARAREVAVRSVLGARSARLVRQVLTESILLSSAGALGGAVLAWWATRSIAHGMIEYSEGLPLQADFPLDIRVLGFLIVLALSIGILAGAAPAMHALRRNTSDVLKQGGRLTGDGLAGRRWRHALVVIQVALSSALLVSGGLFVRSLWHGQAMDLGIRPDGVLVLSADSGLQGHDEHARRAFYERTTERVRALPGVTSAAWGSFLVFSGTIRVCEVFPDGQPPSPQDQRRSALYSETSEDYLPAVGMTLLKGRAFTAADDQTSRRVALVNQTLSEQLWGDAEPIGRQLSLDRPGQPLVEVVGVVRDAKYMFLWEDPRPLVLVPARQQPPLSATLHVRTLGDASALATAVREIVRAVDPDLPVYDVRTLRQHMTRGNALGPFWLGAELVGLLGIVGTLLAAIGLYGMMAFYVDQRQHEIGVRVALGASPGAILRLVVGRGLTLTLWGVGIGVLIAAGIGRLLRGMLLGVGPGDPLVYGLALGTLIAVALATCSLPARRATRVDPIGALKVE